ncbi:MAG: hypothetical protein GX855_04510 [Firmicutes bacterium]|jgi:hypothetical protein|nr:hypothetical protein [Bacillota bacterium]
MVGRFVFQTKLVSHGVKGLVGGNTGHAPVVFVQRYLPVKGKKSLDVKGTGAA